MILRILLVGLVASMGLELPSGSDVSALDGNRPIVGNGSDGRPIGVRRRGQSGHRRADRLPAGRSCGGPSVSRDRRGGENRL